MFRVRLCKTRGHIASPRVVVVVVVVAAITPRQYPILTLGERQLIPRRRFAKRPRPLPPSFPNLSPAFHYHRRRRAQQQQLCIRPGALPSGRSRPSRHSHPSTTGIPRPQHGKRRASPCGEHQQPTRGTPRASRCGEEDPHPRPSGAGRAARAPRDPPRRMPPPARAASRAGSSRASSRPRPRRRTTGGGPPDPSGVTPPTGPRDGGGDGASSRLAGSR